MHQSLTVYKASAGSGKTFTLAVQYIKLLITSTPQEYRHTLAVTFTNKATAEMKERILEQLYGISEGLKSSEGYVEALKKDLHEEGIEMKVEDIRNKCRWALHEILHDYSRFRVETIDSFFQSVLRNLAHELNLSAKMQVDLNDKEILGQAVDNMIDDLGRKDGDVLPWIDAYIKERIESGDKWDVRDEIKKFAQCILSENFMRRDESIRQKLTSGENLKAFRSEMHKMEKQIEEAVEEKVAELKRVMHDSGLDFAGEVNNSSTVLGFVKKVENFRDTLKASPTGDDYFWGKTLETNTGDPEKFINAKNRKNSAKVASAIPVIAKIRETNDFVHQYIKPYLTIRLSLKHLNPLRLLNHIDNEVTEITSEANRFILAKTPILLSRLIEGSDAPFVFEKMGTLFHNVMIDEFQDTSRLQWENFKVLMLENQAQGGRDLLVGDIKQSIYRWRNGDWRILANIEQEMSKHKPTVRNLDHNFRSERNIIEFNNLFFPLASQLINGKSKEIDIEKDIYGDVKQKCNKKETRGWVRTAVFDSQNKAWEEQMLNDLCEQVEDLHRGGVPYDEMCILQRDRNKVDNLIAYFKEHLPHVNLVSDEAFKLESSKTLNIIVHALKYLYDGENDPVSLHILMQRYLVDIKHATPQTTDYTLVKPESILPREAFLDRKDELVTYPISELCEEIYSVLDLKEIKGEDSYLLCFYDELSAYLQNAPGDIASFLEYWDSDLKVKAIPACKVNGISIITIHKSKGLQYHTVLMPYCNFNFENFKADDLLWCEPSTSPFSQMKVLPIQPGKQMQNSLYAPEMEAEALQKNIEELNALYVAFTRAEKNLLVWCKDGSSLTAGNIISQTVSQISELTCEEAGDGVDSNHSVYSLGEPVYECKKKSEESNNRLSPTYEQQDIKMCSYRRRHNFKQSTEGMLFIEELDEEVDQDALRTVDGLTYAQQGSLLHEIFSKIEHADQLKEVIQQYVDSGVLTNGKQEERISKLISRSMNMKQAKPWFDGSYDIHNECEITFLNRSTGKAEVLRPDRVMMKGNEIVVVDFKFGKPHPEAYNAQVKGYMDLMKEMYPSCQISGYIWYVYRSQIVEVK